MEGKNKIVIYAIRKKTTKKLDICLLENFKWDGSALYFCWIKKKRGGKRKRKPTWPIKVDGSSRNEATYGPCRSVKLSVMSLLYLLQNFTEWCTSFHRPIPEICRVSDVWPILLYYHWEPCQNPFKSSQRENSLTNLNAWTCLVLGLNCSNSLTIVHALKSLPLWGLGVDYVCIKQIHMHVCMHTYPYIYVIYNKNHIQHSYFAIKIKRWWGWDISSFQLMMPQPH